MAHSRWTGWLMVMVLLVVARPVAAEWTQQHEIFGNGNTLIAIGAGTDKNAVAYGVESTSGKSQPLLLVTKDGKNWNKVAAPSEFFMLQTIEMLDDQFVFAGGLGMYKSQSGGQSFDQVTLPGGGGLFDMTIISRIHALDPVHVWAVAEKNLYWTPNSLNWEVTEATIDDVNLTALYFATPLIGWVGGGNIEDITEEDWEGNEVVVGHDIKPKGIVLQTTDGGKSFAPKVIGANEAYRHLTFIDQNVGWAVASSNDNPWYLKRTVDGGESWKDVELPSCPDGLQWMWLSKLVFPKPLKGWAAGACGDPEYELDNMSNKAVIIKTANAGSSWEFDPEGEGKGGYLDIDFAGEHWGFAVGTFAHIMAFTDGTEWIPPDMENDIVEGDEDLLAQEDVMTWGNVFGVFGEEVLISEESYPTGSNPINVGKDDPNCTSETRDTGCSAGRSSGGSYYLLLALLLMLGALRARRWGLVATLLLLAACGGTETAETCVGPDLAGNQPTAADVADDTLVMAPFQCGLTSDGLPLSFGDSEARVADAGGQIVYVQQHADGGSDLVLIDGDGKNPVQLTEFNDPAVHVWNPSWAPGRNAVAFVTDYRAAFNDKGQNVFVIALDRSVCYQLTPGVEAARLMGIGGPTATITSSFRYGQGAIASPVADASVAFAGADAFVTTGAGGEFSIAVPPGTGQLILRGTVNGMQVKGLADYEVAEGESLDLEPIIGFVEAEYTIARLHWSSSAALLFAFVSEQLDSLVAIDTSTGESELFLASEEDRVVVFAPFPDAAMAVVAYNSDSEKYFVFALSDPPEKIHEFDFSGQSDISQVTVSPMRFLATVQSGRLVLLGADSAGELSTVDVTPDNVTGLIPGQLDWSPDGAQVITTVDGGGKTNLMIIDVNARTAKAVTTTGNAAMPAWFGM
jgi:hypothetical protein